MKTIEVGDVVTGISGYPLHCGSGIYTHAIVVQVSPLVLVSESTDMRWNCVTLDTLEIIGKADKKVVQNCIDKRLT